MPKTRAEKEKIIKELNEEIKKQKAMIFVDFSGVAGKDILRLKNNLKQADSLLKVCKKTLLNLALAAKKIRIDIKELKGQLAVVFCFADEIKAAKEVYQFCRENEALKIIGGFSDDEFRGRDYFVALAQLPSKQELWAKLLNTASAPFSNLVYLLQGNIKGLLYVLAKAKT